MTVIIYWDFTIYINTIFLFFSFFMYRCIFHYNITFKFMKFEQYTSFHSLLVSRVDHKCINLSIFVCRNLLSFYTRTFVRKIMLKSFVKTVKIKIFAVSTWLCESRCVNKRAEFSARSIERLWPYDFSYSSYSKIVSLQSNIVAAKRHQEWKANPGNIFSEFVCARSRRPGTQFPLFKEPEEIPACW